MLHSVRVIFAGLALSLSTAGLGGGGAGSIPLRSGGSGSIPLRLQGEALALHQGEDGVGLDPSLKRLTSILATVEEVGQKPEDLVIACRLAGANKAAKAEGTIVLGAEVFKLEGICFNEETKMMEFVSTGSQGDQPNSANVIGKIPEDGVLNRFEGRVTINSNASRQRFVINTESTSDSSQLGEGSN